MTTLTYFWYDLEYLCISNFVIWIIVKISDLCTLSNRFIHVNVYMTIHVFWSVVDLGRSMWLYEWGYAIFIFLSSLMTYHRVCSKSDTYRVTCGWGPAHLSGAPEFTLSFKWGSRCSIFSFLCNALWIVVCPFSFGHCVVCPSIYGFWLLRWYLQSFLHGQNGQYFHCTCDKFDNTFKTKYTNTHQSSQ
jgi:hypothetical protein